MAAARFAAYEGMPLLQRICRYQATSKHACDLLQGIVLMYALYVCEEVEMQGARHLCFDTTEQRVNAPEDASLRLCVAAVSILTWVSPMLQCGHLGHIRIPRRRASTTRV